MTSLACPKPLGVQGSSGVGWKWAGGNWGQKTGDRLTPLQLRKAGHGKNVREATGYVDQSRESLLQWESCRDWVRQWEKGHNQAPVHPQVSSPWISLVRPVTLTHLMLVPGPYELP